MHPKSNQEQTRVVPPQALILRGVLWPLLTPLGVLRHFPLGTLGWVIPSAIFASKFTCIWRTTFSAVHTSTGGHDGLGVGLTLNRSGCAGSTELSDEYFTLRRPKNLISWLGGFLAFRTCKQVRLLSPRSSSNAQDK